jgi:hypothetical protein
VSSNYDEIRADNIREYGEGTRHLAFLSRLYSDRTHFVFELLQNAEDARATKVSFSLFADHLEVRHDGRYFNEMDVRGVCGVDEGTKGDDLTKIGKFGIGFKSVYAYTTRPEIHSGSEHFYIENYVRPYQAELRDAEETWTTLFIFPFNHTQVTTAQAHKEIEERLGSLSVRTLLFLRNIAQIEWKVDGGAAGTYSREEFADVGVRHVKVMAHHGAAQGEEKDWLIFERPVQLVEDRPPVRVEIAFKVVTDKTTGKPVIDGISNSNLVVFFPTEKPTNLGFLVQGPFRTTPARDNIPHDDETNKKLIEEIANLIATTLDDLRTMGLLTVGVLESMPIRPASFPRLSMFRPIYDRVREALRTRALLPKHEGGYAIGNQVKLARGAELLDLLSPRQLGELLGRQDEVFWLSGEITADRTPDLYRYIVGWSPYGYGSTGDTEPLIREAEFSPETLVAKITGKFVAKQDDTWVTNLYGFLAGRRSQWPLLLSKEIIRLEDGQHVSPQRADGRPGAYLPPEGPTEFPIVKREIANDSKADQLLRGLGLSEPDAVEEVLEKVLPKYRKAKKGLTVEEHKADIRKIISALKSTDYNRHFTLLQGVRTTHCLLARDADKGIIYYTMPRQAYLKTRALETYFEGNPRAYFVWEGYQKEELEAMLEWGVSEDVRVQHRRPNYRGHIVIQEAYAWHVRGLHGFDPDCQFDGLEHALEHITPQKAVFIWNELLIPNQTYVKGIVETSRRKTYDGALREEKYSRLGELVRGRRWLPDRDGEFRLPSEISLDDLPQDFEPDSALALQLELKANRLSLLAVELGVETDDIQFIKENRAEFEELKRRTRENQELVRDDDGVAEGEESDESEVGTIDYQAELTKSFERPGRGRVDDRLSSHGLVSDPERRREKVKEEIEAALGSEPDVESRFKRVPRKIWGTKNSSVRTFLLEEYDGRCQICDDKNAFEKGNGEPYFEGVYMVSHTKAKWSDTPGNVLSLCATCCAKFEYGAVVAEDVVTQVLEFRTRQEGGLSDPNIRIELCGEEVRIRFNERHILELQELLKVSSDDVESRDVMHAST